MVISRPAKPGNTSPSPPSLPERQGRASVPVSIRPQSGEGSENARKEPRTGRRRILFELEGKKPKEVSRSEYLGTVAECIRALGGGDHDHED
jgi:hypothetical protein